MAYTKGDKLHAHAEFRDPHTNQLVDPTTVLFLYENPAGTETTLTYGTDDALTKTSTGKYQAIVTLDTAGDWDFEWRTTGDYAAVEPFTRTVAASHFA